MQDTPIQHWNSYYDKNNDFGFMASPMLTRVLEDVDPTLSKFCLDIGCGTGQLTRELYHRGYHCLSLDLSDSAIHLARSHTIYGETLTYKVADVETIESAQLTSDTYSLITCKLVFAFIQDKDAFLKKVAKLLADRGTFVIITPIDTSDAVRSIAVDFQKTDEQLRAHFGTVKSFEGLGVTYFICKKE